ncbi:MAG: urate hydroxylase PuuD [Acidimicrobiia bacterium]
MLATVLDIFSRGGYAYISRYLHVVVGITWIGLLDYFNFVQVPAFAEMEGAARNNAIDKLASRALWWFRWAAVATVVTGLLILGLQRTPDGSSELSSMDYFKSLSGISIATGILLALTMFVNVWGIIWRNQKIVIANARNVQAGGEADPAAAGAGRKALMASRMNAIFSLPMLVFMVGTAHFPYQQLLPPEGSKRAIYWGVTIVIWAVLEANALGWIGGTKPGGTNAIYDTHKNALITGFVLAVVWLFLFSLALAR